MNGEELSQESANTESIDKRSNEEDINELELERLSDIANEQVARIGFWETDRTHWEKVFGGKTVEVRRENDERFRSSFPPEAFTSRRYGENKIILAYNEATVSDITNELSHIPEISEDDIRRMYVGLGVVSLSLKELIKPTTDGIGKFYDTLALKDRLLDLPKKLDISTRENELSLRQALLIRTPDQTARTNVLRLCMGLYLFIDEYDDDTLMPIHSTNSRIVESFRQGLDSTLNGRSVYIATLKAFGKLRHEAEQMWAESVSDLQLAGAMPMELDEIIETLKPIQRLRYRE